LIWKVGYNPFGDPQIEAIFLNIMPQNP
jgi:hypothetical protein